MLRRSSRACDDLNLGFLCVLMSFLHVLYWNTCILMLTSAGAGRKCQTALLSVSLLGASARCFCCDVLFNVSLALELAAPYNVDEEAGLMRQGM